MAKPEVLGVWCRSQTLHGMCRGNFWLGGVWQTCACKCHTKKKVQQQLQGVHSVVEPLAHALAGVGDTGLADLVAVG